MSDTNTNSKRIMLAELLGTCVLMLGGPGTAILGGGGDGIGLLAIALGFGFSLAIMAYVIGPPRRSTRPTPRRRSSVRSSAASSVAASSPSS
jgi:hypothetical protein